MSRFSERQVRSGLQRGDVLLEALLGVLITALVGAGMAHVASRISVSHRDAKIEALAVERMRDLLQNKGVALCTLPETDRQFTLPDGEVVTPEVDCPEVAASIELTLGEAAGAISTVTPDEIPREVILSVAAADLGLGDAEGQPALVVGTRQLPAEGS